MPHPAPPAPPAPRPTQLDPARLAARPLARSIRRLLSDAATARRAAALGASLRARSGPDEAAALIQGFAADAIPCRRRGGGAVAGGAGAGGCCAACAPWVPFAPPPLCCEPHALRHAAANLFAKAALLLAAGACLYLFWGPLRAGAARAGWVLLAAALSPP
jgi:hypothetical protein